MRFLFGLFILLNVLISQGQSIPLKNYGLAQGLPSSEVYDVFQDSNGFMWFSTDNGVVKYDGYKFQVFNISEGLPDPVVFETMEDTTGKIWFRTFSGRIAYYEKGKIQAYLFNDKLSKICENYHLISMALDSLGQLWFSSYQGMGAIDTKGKVTMEKMNLQHVYYKSVGNSSIIGWKIIGPLKTQNYLSIDNKPFPFALTHEWEDPKTSHPVKKAIKWNSNLYISINNNIFKYDGQSLTLAYIGDSPIISLSIDNNNNLWAGLFNNGAIRFSKDLTNPWTFPALKKNSITKIIQDNEGGYWFTTLENGVNYMPNINFIQYNLNSNSKIRTGISESNKILIGETDGTLNIFNNETGQFIKTNFQRGILYLLKTDQNWWISTSYELRILDNELNQTLKRHRGNFVDFTIDRNGYIWAIETGGFSRFDNFGNLVFSNTQRIGQRAILAIDSTLLIGLHTGLKVFDFEFKPLLNPEILKNYKISKLKQINDTTIFIGTIGNGFFISDSHLKNIKHFKSPAHNIYSIVDNYPFYWIGTELGIIKLNIDSVLNSKVTYELITQQNGLAHNQVSQLSLTGSGNLIAFYNNQFTIIKKDKIYFSNKKPKFYLESLKINNATRDYSVPLALPHYNNNLQINLGFISFNHQDILVRYKLNNKAEWSYTNDRQINLYSLSPNIYTPEIQYTADKVNWYKATLPTIKIMEPWWQTLIFQLSILIAFSLFIYIVFKNRITIYKERTEKMEMLTKHQKLLIQKEIDTMEKERSRIAKELHDGVGPNLLATKLTVNKILKTHQIEDTENIDDKFQLTFKDIKAIIYELTPPGLERNGLAASLKGYIDWLSKSTETRISFSNSSNEITNMKIILPVFRIVQELISNTIKHSKASDIFIELNVQQSLLSVTYRDNGNGFVEDYVNGFGLFNLESRTHALNGKLQFKSSESGVLYTIEIPLTNGGLS